MIQSHHIDTAYVWLCKQRKHYPANSDVWHLRFHWTTERERILTAITTGSYYFKPLQLITKADGSRLHLWSSDDALVLKALSLAIAPSLSLSKRCTHVKGHGGLKFTVRQVHNQLPQYQFVIRTDVRAFYESINHPLLMDRLAGVIKDPDMLNLLCQCVHRCVEWGGLFRDIDKGIPRGCPLSPMLGAFYLNELDQQFEQDVEQGKVFYIRYMDDILIMTKKRWVLRKAIKRLNGIFNQLQLEKHPDKTFIGKIAKGFDFLGYHFDRERLSLAAKTVSNAIVKVYRLYEQNKTEPDKGSAVIDKYCRRWLTWTVAGLHASVN